MFLKCESSYTDFDAPECIKALVDSFLKAETPTVRLQILSILANHYSFKDINAKIPSVTQHKFYTARKHAKDFGVGAQVPVEKRSREKVETAKLEHFLDFITSNQVIKDLPLGEKTLTLSTGEIIQTPYVIRCLAPATIVRQYSQLCIEENFEPIGQSTMYMILAECSAAMRRSVEGVDYYVAEASEAFRALEDMVREMQIPAYEQKEIVERLMQAKHYLKTDFKMHVRPSSNVADHCLSHALSEADSLYFEEECSHHHSDSCVHCYQLDNILSSILDMVKDASWDNPDAYLFKVEKSVSAIKELKAHVLRSKNQGRARTNVTENLGDGDLFLVADWAMKFLPRKFREGQTDWFGKRGINWHIAVCATKNNDSYVLDTYLHILDSQCPQDSRLTTALIIDVVKDMANRREVHNVHIWSDNAGCYKSSYTLYALHQELKPIIKSYNFCEAQDGKGPCDRKASHIKSAIKRYVNEGNDVLDASQMKKAIDTQQHGQYRVKVVTPIIDVNEDKCAIKAIPNLSLLNNFEFSPDGLRVWKAYNIGSGKLYPWINAEVPVTQLNINQTWPIDVHSALLPLDDDESPEHNQSSEPVPKKQKTSDNVFHCANEECDRNFKTLSSLEHHQLLGNCSLRPEKNLLDRSKVLYQEKLSTVNTTCSTFYEDHSQSSTAMNEKSVKQIGWALKIKKQKVFFNDDQKDFLNEKFNIGKLTGKKEDPAKVSRDMPYVKKDGKHRFGKEEYLTPTQVASFFSRLSQKDRKCEDGDFLAASSDKKMCILKAEVLSRL
ncbi:uncharacterized protein LOC128158002 [Crassostrea angulata]|uniref:uncharacterized protein LOC128158002 n=1 Tax=Magallana angulata TaxID=2784310 RepID=UPI0022B0B903|nr:uncharacterized protein LOC128158002 [Crassostrea angulata]